MNAKIKELIEQAKEQVSQPEGTYGLISDYVFKFNKEKFAELIVRECITMADELKVQYLSYRKEETDFEVKNIYAEGEAACDTLKYRMKKHFGVE